MCIPGKQFLNHRVEPDTRSGEEPSLCREQVGTEEAELLPSEKFWPNDCHGNGMLPTKLCDTIDPL